MISLSLQKLIAVLNAECLGPIEPASAIDNLTIDSRTIRPGRAFFALKGRRFDGHDFAAEVANKATACRRRRPLPSDNTTPVLLVPNVLGTGNMQDGIGTNFRHTSSPLPLNGQDHHTPYPASCPEPIYRCHQAVKKF